MVLNYLWIAFFLLSFIVATVRLLMGDTLIFKEMMDGVFNSAKTSVDISIGLIGIMSLFLGFMNIGEKAGAVNLLSRIVGPLFSKLFPELPKNHPAFGTMMMSFSANMLGLDNAATPFSLKAMKSLQELNPSSHTATNAQIMFMVLNASGLTIIPVSIIAQRSILKSNNPTEVFIPLLIATFISTMVAMAVTAFWQKFTRKQWGAIIAFGLGGAILVTGLGYLLRYVLSPDSATGFSNVVSNGIIMLIFVLFILGGMVKKVNIFNTFIEGAKQGLMVCIRIIPYLVAMLVAISLLRTSGVFEFIISSISWSVAAMGMDTQWVPALPTALMKPLSGSGARGMMIDAMTQYGPDSFVGRLACVFQGTTETTFYIVAVYFGSVNIRNTRHAIPAALIADLAGIIAAILIVYNWPWSS
ncbi:nucleoside recognition domain-containing protein [Gynurincola endophyticus]|jgi:spore maturation protein SpmA/spore maturation protein SpmB|uniref:nucleoside recognition domain-containing protein n=1 Tax=Gynurincola endophyticus TaxID=2479004 RepID=UPI000F8D5C25|nr:spore maturation protein [Gynurincola endophyticus]